MANIDHTIDRIRVAGVIAIVRGQFSTRQIVSIASALMEGGLSMMEVTLNSTDALEHIRTLREHAGTRMMIGAGTVRTADDVDRAIGAGAEFLISPGLDAASIECSQSADVLQLPGVFTPTEAMHAASLGCKVLKLFPCDVVGPKYLKALRAPLDDVEFVPTGGVAPGNLAEWRRAGAMAVAAGSSLVSGPEQSIDELRARARTMRDAWENAKNA